MFVLDQKFDAVIIFEVNTYMTYLILCVLSCFLGIAVAVASDYVAHQTNSEQK